MLNLTELENDALIEIFNIGVGQAARHAEPDATVAAGDDRHFAAEIE